jgi:integrase
MGERRSRGRGSISELPSGRLRAQVYLGSDPVTGRRRFTSRTFTSKRAAETWLREQHPTGPPSSRATVAALLDGWISYQTHRAEVAGTISRSTLSWYRSAVTHHLAPALGPLEVGQVTSADLARLLTRTARQGGPGGRPLGRSSIRRLVVVLRAAFAWGVQEGWLTRNPAGSLESPKPERSGAVERVWTIEQVRLFLDETADTPLGPLWRLLATTGLRRGEGLGLRWSAVTFPDIGEP